MRSKALFIAAITLLTGSAIGTSPASALEPVEQLGKSIFFDKNLSLKKNQSCAACHDPRTGFSGPNPAINDRGSVYPGSVKTAFGNRKPPTSAYATPSPVLHFIMEGEGENAEAVFIGGNLWNGRATGENLGNPAADQAQGPFLNPVEQGLPDSACVVYRVCNAKTPAQYPVALTDVYAGACDIDWPARVDADCKAGESIELDPIQRANVEADFAGIALAIAAYEASSEVNSYTSKFDAWKLGKADLTDQEMQGFDLFVGRGGCAACHSAGPQASGDPALFTNFRFENLGVPKNPENPVYDEDPDFIDWGLGKFLESRSDYDEFAEENLGYQKVPTLRNVDRRRGNGFAKAYMHNGYFKSLEGVVHFYNTRDVKPECPDPMTTEEDALAQGCWPAPEVSVNIDDTVGALGLTAEEEDAIVAFLETLSDGYFQR
ncbi:MAG: cytochrome-c peroxidase [Candidatus Wenzhouxiangella sp. M2_3B_020]